MSGGRGFYGAQHRRTRQQWQAVVAAGVVRCMRCSELIQPGQPWHLDHQDHDRTAPPAPSHAHCNTSAGGKINRKPLADLAATAANGTTSRKW